ncbi:magnesium transporter MRS2-5 isoform X2 [Alnus glutinosa]|uniref:magnesium transporter MRS2-5 isoform X2 n=1 Tax=Alnus glutinosa TaxID=3517 RepID=UPI002D7899D2|nr:magnesium transporter MRS2-5 isoform X2 [Alnus glutinosa]
MEKSHNPFRLPNLPESASTQITDRFNLDGYGSRGAFLTTGLKKRGHGSRSWTKIDKNGNSKILKLDKATIMRHCSLPARDLRLLDPVFIYPSTILGREKAIVVSLEQIRCIITADEVILMNSLDGCVVQYQSELCKRLLTNRDQTGADTMRRALELALELICMSLDAQVKQLEMELYPGLDELATSISTLNLERVRRLKGHLLGLTRRVQKVRDEIEHLMDDDGDMAEMYLTEKKQKSEAYTLSDLYLRTDTSGGATEISKSAPVSPVASISGAQNPQRAFNRIFSMSKYGSLTGSSDNGENIEQLEMLLEAYFVVADNSLSKLLSLKEYIDDTEDFINIKLGNVQNHLIQFQLLLTAATFAAAIFACVTAVFGMNFADSVFDHPSMFNWVLVITGGACGFLYFAFLFYLRHRKIIPL